MSDVGVGLMAMGLGLIGYALAMFSKEMLTSVSRNPETESMIMRYFWVIVGFLDFYAVIVICVIGLVVFRTI